MGGAGYHGFRNGIAVGSCSLSGASVSLAGASVKKVKKPRESNMGEGRSVLPIIYGPGMVYLADDDSSNSSYDSHGCDSDCGESSDGGGCGGD